MKLRLIAALLATLPNLAVCAQTEFSIDFSQRRQKIEGLGFTATGTWIPSINDLYAQETFANQISQDLGPSIVRLALPPAIQPKPDLDPDTLDLARFDFTKFSPPANFIQNLHKQDPAIKVMLSVWSPPAWMKDNDSTVNGGHLRADRRAHFAKFCAAACKGFELTYGVPVYALSIQNEPVFVEKYDSCVYTPADMRDTIKAVAAAFQAHGVKSLLMAPEDVHDTPRFMTFVDAIKADDRALAAISIFNFHGIPSKGWPDLRDRIAPLNKQLWMTETSGQSPDWSGGIAVATEIHNALTLGGCSAWVYWALTDPSPDEFALMSLSTGTSKYWAAKHFFKFVRPGSFSVAVTPSKASIYISAFIYPDDQTVTINLINPGTSDADVSLTLKNLPAGVKSLQRFRSTAADTCVPLDEVPVLDDRLSTGLEAHGITTLLAHYTTP